MKTEINNDWKGYLSRFKMPSTKALLWPLKYVAICLPIQAICCYLATISNVLMLVMSSMIMVVFLYAVFRHLWEVVLEEAKGFWADAMMWLYYIAIVFVTLLAPILVAIPYL
jgi:hypothetical protein